jgi:hypothetical protein
MIGRTTGKAIFFRAGLDQIVQMGHPLERPGQPTASVESSSSRGLPANGPSDEVSVNCMADYQPLLTRVIANLASASTLAARQEIYERARIAQRVQLRTRYPSLRKSDIAREEGALEDAIALVEAKFGGGDASLAKTTIVMQTPPLASQGASEKLPTASAARTEALIPPAYRPAQIGPQSAGPDVSGMWLWPASTAALTGLFAAALGAVLAVTGAAIVMRHTPPDLRGAPPEALQELPAEQPTTTAERAQASWTERNSTATATSVPQPLKQSGAGPAIQTQDASGSQLPGIARAVMLIASDDPQRPMESLGKTVWSIIPPAPGHPATVAVRADADIPDLKMRATMILRKNTDPTLQATHTIDLKFSFADGAPVTGVKNVEPKMRNLGLAASEALPSVKVKISDTYFLVALVKSDQDAARNLDLIQTRAWFDFSLLLNDDRIAKLVFQKSLTGEAMLAKAFEVWK